MTPRATPPRPRRRRSSPCCVRRIGLRRRPSCRRPESRPEPHRRPPAASSCQRRRPRASTAVTEPGAVADADRDARRRPPTASSSRRTGPLSSDRMTDVERLVDADGADVITFVFGNASLPGPAGQPRGDLAVAEPPYTEARQRRGRSTCRATTSCSSGSCSMSLVRPTPASPTYDGPARVQAGPAGPRVTPSMFDESEGQIGWYIGYDGPGCVTLGRDGDDVTVSFAQP